MFVWGGGGAASRAMRSYRTYALWKAQREPCPAPPRRSYGEDPVHVSAMGVAHTLALQNRSAPTPTGDYFVQLSAGEQAHSPCFPWPGGP